MRRAVTGRDRAGKSIFASEGPVPRGVAMNGVPRFRIDEVWTAAGVPELPASPENPRWPSIRSFQIPAAPNSA